MAKVAAPAKLTPEFQPVPDIITMHIPVAARYPTSPVLSIPNIFVIEPEDRMGWQLSLAPAFAELDRGQAPAH